MAALKARSLFGILAGLCGLIAYSEAASELETVVVTAVRMSDPLRVETDPSRPRQPLPAHDGADYLKTIPGFNVVRKGGTDGDPLFRGMAASRINILLNGESLSGGCSSRMDPPTAYVFPETYDRITVIKGPQTVKHGPGNSAATVLFEKFPARREAAGWNVAASLTGASFGRNDQVLNVRGGSRDYVAELDMTRAAADDYRDGSGNPVHSAYERWSTGLSLGITPSEDSYIELHGLVSDGEAAYADRLMDGARFKRENLGVKWGTDTNIAGINRIEGQVYYNYVDHVMDNYSLRRFVPSMMMPGRSASNPDRETVGAKMTFSMDVADDIALDIGGDAQRNRHSERGTRNQLEQLWQRQPRLEDAEFRNIALFSEADWDLGSQRHIVGGWRIDQWQAEDYRDTIALGMMGVMAPNPSAGKTRDEWLHSGFIRYETPVEFALSSAMIGIGYVQRFPDYWEMIGRKETTDSISAFDIEVEKTTQIDVGLIHRSPTFSASLNVFANDIRDYILIESAYQKGPRQTTVARNIDARTWGAEAALGLKINNIVQIDQSVAWVRGDNLSDDRPLAQQPALESRTSLTVNFGAWDIGVLWRWVADQDRIALNQGNVVGQDLAESDGFKVLSINGGWEPRHGLRVSAGVDNLLNETYAEHISRGGAIVPGYQATERVNEPGRVAWLKIAYTTP